MQLYELWFAWEFIWDVRFTLYEKVIKVIHLDCPEICYLNYLNYQEWLMVESILWKLTGPRSVPLSIKGVPLLVLLVVKISGKYPLFYSQVL